MTAIYEVRIKSRAGVLREILTGAMGDPYAGHNDGYSQLSYVREVNSIGSGMFVINAESAVVDTLAPNGEPELDAQVEFWRYDPDNEIEPYCDFYGFLRDREYQADDNGQVRFVAYLEEQSDLLRRAAVLYRANIDGRSSFDSDPAETILKALVTYNATNSGTTGDGRDRNVDSWGANISVAANTAAGTSLTRSYMGRNLYEVLREVAESGGLDWSLVKTGAQSWQFRTATLLGTDRSSGTNTVTFSLPYGNMRRPTLRGNHRTEKTVGIIGGQGTDSSRAVRVRTGTNYNTLYNSYEVFVNGSQYSTNAGLDSEADERLEEMRARDSLNFDVIQVPSTLYGKHYFLGDKVRAYFMGFSYTPQIRRVAIDVRARGSQPTEQIQITAADT